MTTKIKGTEGVEFPDSSVQSTAALLLSAFTGSNQSKTANGYQKLPGGIVIQWGQYTKPITVGSVDTTFPISFPTACLAVVVTKIGNVNGVTPVMTGLINFTTTQFTTTVSDGTLASTYQYVAIGY